MFKTPEAAPEAEVEGYSLDPDAGPSTGTSYNISATYKAPAAAPKAEVEDQSRDVDAGPSTAAANLQTGGSITLPAPSTAQTPATPQTHAPKTETQVDAFAQWRADIPSATRRTHFLADAQASDTRSNPFQRHSLHPNPGMFSSGPVRPLTAANLRAFLGEPEVVVTPLPAVNLPTTPSATPGLLAVVWRFVAPLIGPAIETVRAIVSLAREGWKAARKPVQVFRRRARKSFANIFRKELPEILEAFARDIGQGTGLDFFDFIIGPIHAVFAIFALLMNLVEWWARLTFDTLEVLYLFNCLLCKGLAHLIPGAFLVVYLVLEGLIKTLINLFLLVVNIILRILLLLERVWRDGSLWPRTTILGD